MDKKAIHTAIFFIQAYELEEINKNKVNNFTEKLYRLQKSVLVLDR